MKPKSVGASSEKADAVPGEGHPAPSRGIAWFKQKLKPSPQGAKTNVNSAEEPGREKEEQSDSASDIKVDKTEVVETHQDHKPPEEPKPQKGHKGHKGQKPKALAIQQVSIAYSDKEMLISELNEIYGAGQYKVRVCAPLLPLDVWL